MLNQANGPLKAYIAKPSVAVNAWEEAVAAEWRKPNLPTQHIFREDLSHVTRAVGRSNNELLMLMLAALSRRHFINRGTFAKCAIHCSPNPLQERSDGTTIPTATAGTQKANNQKVESSVHSKTYTQKTTLRANLISRTEDSTGARHPTLWNISLYKRVQSSQTT